jgi:hypothetical protein
MPAMLTNNRPSMSPTSIGRAVAPSAAAMARSGRGSMRSSRARPLPDPAGMIPSGTSPNASAEATSLIVPSPPQARTDLTPRAAASRASSCA